MKVTNSQLYRQLSSYIRGICDNSIQWEQSSCEFQSLVDYLTAEKIIVEAAKTWEPEGIFRDTISAWVLRFYDTYKDKLQKLVWNRRAFDETYEEFERFIYSDGVTEVCVSPIYSLKCEFSKPLEFDEDIAIVTTEYDKNIQRIIRRIDKNYAYRFAHCDWCIRTKLQVPKLMKSILFETDEEARLKIENVAVALRLLHSGFIFFGRLYVDRGFPYGDTCHFSVSPILADTPDIPISIFASERYVLEAHDIQRLKQLHQQLRNVSQPHREFLSIAINRLNYSYQRLNQIDRLIDLCVALESLYVPELDELSYRLALRCACFLEQNEEEKQKTFQTLKKIYRTRSQIVHGSERQSKVSQ